MSHPLVSVIIPTFNRSNLLREALNSVDRQTLSGFETIVVDDGSTEDLGGACAGHRVQPIIVRQERLGPAAARNRGVGRSTGELLAFLDSDDEWLPEKLETFLGAMKARPGVGIWYGPMRPIDAEGGPVAGRTKPCHAGRIARELFDSSFVHVPTVVCRRALFEQFGGFDESLPVCEDYDLWLRMSATCEFGLVESPLALRRLHTSRLSKSCMRRNLAVKADVLERFYRGAGRDAGLDDAAARERLARVMLAAARAALRDHHYGAAAEMIERARRYGASRLRVLPFSAAARMLSWAGLGRSLSGPGGFEAWRAEPVSTAKTR